eukprot:6480442-Amphidinium_carterae.1
MALLASDAELSGLVSEASLYAWARLSAEAPAALEERLAQIPLLPVTSLLDALRSGRITSGTTR